MVRHRNIWLMVAIAASLMLAACQRGGKPDEAETKLVIALFSPGGLGDRGYNDEILSGLQRVHKDRDDCAMLFLSPDSLEEAELIFSEWYMRPSSGMPCLFILASVEYEPMALRVLERGDGDMNNKAVLLFETDTRLNYPHCYTFKINMYGASYLAGTMVAAMGLESPLIMLGAESDQSIRYASDGFSDGYMDASGRTTDLGFFAEDWHGYVMSQGAYERMPELSRGHDFIYPVAGGTNMGVYRYLRDHPDGPYVAGMDIDQSPFCNNIVGSLIKHIDRLVIDGITGWLDSPLNDQAHVEFGLESGYVDWQVSERFKEYAPLVEQNRAKAIEREEARQ